MSRFLADSADGNWSMHSSCPGPHEGPCWGSRRSRRDDACCSRTAKHPTRAEDAGRDGVLLPLLAATLTTQPPARLPRRVTGRRLDWLGRREGRTTCCDGVSGSLGPSPIVLPVTVMHRGETPASSRRWRARRRAGLVEVPGDEAATRLQVTEQRRLCRRYGRSRRCGLRLRCRLVGARQKVQDTCSR